MRLPTLFSAVLTVFYYSHRATGIPLSEASLTNGSPSSPLSQELSLAPRAINSTTSLKSFSDLPARIVKNSGVCEKTAGVKQYSGYIDVGADQNIFFWFFESRHSPETAPLALWLNGGPGCSSMFGLFQENGPCRLKDNVSEPAQNPSSINEFANVLYVDQPVGVGYSYGNLTGNNTLETTPYLWIFLQAFYARFPEYTDAPAPAPDSSSSAPEHTLTRNFGIFTESYGGHYGPALAEYIVSQNEAIRTGDYRHPYTGAKHIPLVALAINNGIFNHLLQLRRAAEYAFTNPYRPLINESSYHNKTAYWNKLCEPGAEKCRQTNSDADCQISETCFEIAFTTTMNTSLYDVRRDTDDDPPRILEHYLNQTSVKDLIGAKGSYSQCSQAFDSAWDLDIARSYIQSVAKVVDAKIKTLLWFGDADLILNYIGGLDAANAVPYKSQSDFTAKSLTPFTVDGKEHGLFKNVGDLSYMRVYNAGHYVPYFQPELTTQIYKQMLQDQNPTST